LKLDEINQLKASLQELTGGLPDALNTEMGKFIQQSQARKAVVSQEELTSWLQQGDTLHQTVESKLQPDAMDNWLQGRRETREAFIKLSASRLMLSYLGPAFP
jgi:hypothetical protein